MLERFRALDQKRDRGALGDRSVPDPTRDDEELTLPKIDGLVSLELDAEPSLPAEEQLVLVVGVPRERSLELHDAYDGVVGASKVRGFPRLLDAARRESDIDLARDYFAYSTARVSRITVTLI